jgi:hypothetical protein
VRAAALFYIALFAYPACTLLIPDSPTLRWWSRSGGQGKPPAELVERRKRNQWELLIVKFAVLLASCTLLAREARISAAEIGLRQQQPVFAIFGAIGGAVILVLWMIAMSRLTGKVRVRRESPPRLVQQSTFKVATLILIGGFAEEVWRSITLVVSREAGVSAVAAVFISSLVFGLGHVFSFRSLGATAGRAAMPAIAGMVLAALFLFWQTLLVPFIAHVGLNAFGTLTSRKRMAATGTSEPSDHARIQRE